MYADLEEARARRARQASRSPVLEIQRSSKHTGRRSSDGYESRERELAEQLRNRALASRRARETDERGRRRSSSSSTSRRSMSRSLSRSRSRSRDSVGSRRSQRSRRSANRSDQHRYEDSRKRRRDVDDTLNGAQHRRREREAYDADEEARERRRRRHERNDSHDRDYVPASRSISSHHSNSGRYDSAHEDRNNNRGHYDRSFERDRQRPPRHYDDRRDVRRRNSPPAARARRSPSPVLDDYEERSVFCTQLSVRVGQRDLGEFFEEHLGEGAVKDVRIVMDRVTRRSKGVGYVEFAAKELVPKAIELTGQELLGVPIVVQITDAARNRVAQNGSDLSRPNMPAHAGMGGALVDPTRLANIPLPMQQHLAAPLHLPAGSALRRVGPDMPNTEARLYVGSLHFSLTDENVKSVFESFGEIEYVDLHREPGTGKSKGFCFIQYREPESARRALEQMNGFELAGRTIRVGNVNAKGGTGPIGSATSYQSENTQSSGHLPQLTSAFDDGGGAGLNPERRAALMEKLARKETTDNVVPAEQARPANIPESVSTSLLLKNMFDPKEETEPDWHRDLADDVREECQSKYGPVTQIHVERESAGEIYITFADNESSKKAMQGLNGRYFGGKPISAHYIPDAFVKAKLG